jgi:hypothetical protein
MKVVSFADDAPIVHKIPVLAEDEYPLTFYAKDEIEQFRHEAVLEMMGVPLSPPAEALSPKLHMGKSQRKKRASSNVKTDAEALAALAASPLYQAAQVEQSKLGDVRMSGNRPSLGERRPSIREKRGSEDRRRPRQSLATREKDIIDEGVSPEMDLGDQSLSPRAVAPVPERRQRPSAGDRSGGRLVRNSVTRDRSIISAVPPAPTVV